jgi:hypothetical protein
LLADIRLGWIWLNSDTYYYVSQNETHSDHINRIKGKVGWQELIQAKRCEPNGLVRDFISILFKKLEKKLDYVCWLMEATVVKGRCEG